MGKADKGSSTGSYSMSVPSHGAGMLKIAVAAAQVEAVARWAGGTAPAVAARLRKAAQRARAAVDQEQRRNQRQRRASSTGGSKSTVAPTRAAEPARVPAVRAAQAEARALVEPTERRSLRNWRTSSTGGISTGGTNNASGGASTGA